MFARKNLLRRPIRTSLTIGGVAVGVATLVALGAVARGVRGQFDTVFAAGNGYLVVSKKAAVDPFLSYLPDEVIERLRAIRTVTAVHPFLWTIHQLPAQPFFFLYGTVAGSPVLDQVRVVHGRQVFAAPTDRPALCIGKAVALALGKGVGETLDVHGEQFEIVGIFESALPLLEGGGLMALRDAQRISGLEGRVNVALVRIEDPASLRAVEQELEAAVPGIEATEPAGFTRAFDEFRMMDEATRLLSVLAILIGGIGVMNTMLMSVFERLREFGVLRAVGWSRGMVLRLVLAESLALCVLGGIAGIGLGVAGLEALLDLCDVAWLAGDYGWPVFAEALAVAAAMGLAGASYPAVRAVRITPIEALRHV